MCEKVSHGQLLEMLCAFDRVCAKHNICYSLHGGTLLGAVRERGFIPWDDDADIIMTRADFKQLESALNHSKSDYCIRGNVKKQFCQPGNPNAWVDIFVCDYISEKKVPQKVKQHLLTMLDIMNRDQESRKLSNLEKYGKKKQLAYQAAFAMGQMIPKSWIGKWYTYISEKCFLGRRKYMLRSNDQYAGRLLLFPSEWMEGYEKTVFEKQEFSILEAYRGILIQCYGEDYMTPVRYDRNADVHDLIRSDPEFNL